APPASIGEHLRHWRQLRRMSQLDLALEAEISTRHLSFIEPGRSTPSREMVLHLAESLEVPLRERNALLLAAGYAPIYSDPPWNSAEISAIHSALQQMLKKHEPFPALVLDRHWNVLMTNEAAP